MIWQEIIPFYLLQAAILQQTAEYIYQLEQEKTQLLSQNCQLKRLVNQHEGGDVPIKKRKPDTQGNFLSTFKNLFCTKNKNIIFYTYIFSRKNNFFFSTFIN